MTDPISPQRLAEIRDIGNQLRDPTPEASERIRGELLAEVDRLKKELAWHRPEAINTATGAPHRVTLTPDGRFTISHNLGCHLNGGRRETRNGELICHIEAYLDQTDEDERPQPGDYWVIVDVFGRSEEPVEATWLAHGAELNTELTDADQADTGIDLGAIDDACEHLDANGMAYCADAIRAALGNRTWLGSDRARLAARVAELEGEREQLRDEYGIRYKDPDLAHTWHTTWGFSSAEDARGFLAENVQLHGDVLHRLVGEPQPAAAPDRAEGNEQ